MANPTGTRVTLFDGRKGTIVSYGFGAANPSFGGGIPGQPVFIIKLDDESIVNNVPLSVITPGG